MNPAEPLYFPGKILLFGEYGIMYGGEALTVPFNMFSGALLLGAETHEERVSNQNLHKFFTFLERQQADHNLAWPLDLNRMEKDLQSGLFFSSSIPQGYGAGSSGALVAAIFQKYGMHLFLNSTHVSPKDFPTLKKQLATMESFFHGSSSGLDPLCCWMQIPLHVDSNKNVVATIWPGIMPGSPMSVFLIDTLQTGETKPLVDWFRVQTQQGLLNAKLLIDLSNESIKALQTENTKLFYNYLQQLSLFQLENMQPMIPESIRTAWDEGIESGEYTLKLCGSGGGGFVLGFTPDLIQAKASLIKKGMGIITFSTDEKN